MIRKSFSKSLNAIYYRTYLYNTQKAHFIQRPQFEVQFLHFKLEIAFCDFKFLGL